MVRLQRPYLLVKKLKNKNNDFKNKLLHLVCLNSIPSKTNRRFFIFFIS